MPLHSRACATFSPKLDICTLRLAAPAQDVRVGLAVLGFCMFAGGAAQAQAPSITQAPSATQVTTRTVIVSRPRGYEPGLLHLYGTRTVTSVTTQQTVAYREPVLPGGIVPFELLPAVAGIRPTPTAPPSVYRIAGPRTTMHEADELRTQQIKPGARVISPDDLSLSRETRRRYGVVEPGQARGMSRDNNEPQPERRKHRPRVTVVFPEQAFAGEGKSR